MFEKKYKQKKNTKSVLDNMLKMKHEERKLSRSTFYDRVVNNTKPSYKKDLSFLNEKSISKNKSFTDNLNERTHNDFFSDLEDIIRELDESC